MIDFAKYRQWAANQKCCDCGEKATEKTGMWVTETQCYKCWKEKGPPERRGMPSAMESAAACGVLVYEDDRIA